MDALIENIYASCRLCPGSCASSPSLTLLQRKNVAPGAIGHLFLEYEAEKYGRFRERKGYPGGCDATDPGFQLPDLQGRSPHIQLHLSSNFLACLQTTTFCSIPTLAIYDKASREYPATQSNYSSFHSTTYPRDYPRDVTSSGRPARLLPLIL